MMVLRVSVGAAAISWDKKELRAALLQAGNMVAAETRSLIAASTGGGRLYRGGGGGGKYRPYKPGAYTASSPGQAPVSVTGTLAGSIAATPLKKGALGVQVKESVFYALFLQVGATGGGKSKKLRYASRNKKGRKAAAARRVTSRLLLPRPSLTAVLEDSGSAIAQKVNDAVMEGLSMRDPGRAK